MTTAREVAEMYTAEDADGILLCLDGEWFRLPKGCHRTLEYAARQDQRLFCTDPMHAHLPSVHEQFKAMLSHPPVTAIDTTDPSIP